VVTKTKQATSGFDTVKLMTALLILIAGVVGFYYFENESQLLRVIGMLAIAVVAFFIVTTTDIGRRGMGFVREARVEVRKVVACRSGGGVFHRHDHRYWASWHGICA